jgi:glutamyl-tRNA reductase
MSPENPARVFAVGVNHKSGSAFLRDRLFVDEEMLPEFYGRLARESIGQAIVLSTCDRVEIQGAHPDPERAVSVIHEFFRGIGGSDAETLDHALYAHFDDAAVRHIMAVASSLDSQVIGEPQVLGQVKEAHRHAGAAGMIGHEMDDVLQFAYGAAKRVRSETSIGERAVSIASAAVQIAQDIHGDLRERNTLIVGLGEIGDLIVRLLKAAGAHRISLTGPGRRTEREALALGFHFLPFDDLAGGLARADITVSAAGLGRFLVEKGMVDQALRERRRRPMLFLDGGLPADVEPDVHDLDGAFVYTLDDLEQVAQRGRQERVAVATEAWEIVDREVERWRAGRNIKAVVPTLVALRSKFDLAREEILASRPEIDAHEATRLLVNRLLHAPTRALRDLAEQGAEKDNGEMLVRRLFALDKDDGTEGEQ